MQNNMSAFNTKTTKKIPSANIRKVVEAVPNTVNKAGGAAFTLTPEFSLAFALVSSFLEPEFYETRSDTVRRIQDLVSQVDPLFAAKAAIFSRREFGMRSTSHLVAAEIAKKVKGASWTKHFFDQVVYRVDDASEILAAYMALHSKPIPNSLKKGLSLALSKFNRYQLAKYKGSGKGVKLVDLFNLTHPKPSEANAAAFKDLIEGNLPSEDTWESMLSEACRGCKTEEEKASKKRAVWTKLLDEGKLGYFALLRNARNILEVCDDTTIAKAATQLVDRKAIKSSLVLPFRFMTAKTELESMTPSGNCKASNIRVMSKAINDALEISMDNVPTFPGSTLVAIDVSGSMGSAHAGKSPAAIASLFGSVIAKANNADVMLFDTAARYMPVNLSDSVGTITSNLRGAFTGGGTNFRLIFEHATQAYDRILILSDMQAWVTTSYGAWLSAYEQRHSSSNTPQEVYGEYCAKFKANPKVYSFDLKGYGTLQFPQDSVFCLAGFSEKVLDIMRVLEEDPNAFVNRINEVQLG